MLPLPDAYRSALAAMARSRRTGAEMTHPGAQSMRVGPSVQTTR